MGNTFWCGQPAIQAALNDGSLLAAASSGPVSPQVQAGVSQGILPVRGSGPPVAVVYGVLGSPETSSVWHDVVALLKDGVAFGHASPADSVPDQQTLGGYGVELHIKSTEYKVVDEDASSGGEDAQDDPDASSAPRPPVAGIHFSVLAARVPGAEKSLVALESQLAEEETVKPLKKWQVRDLGLRAADMIVSAEDPLAVMNRLAHAFPVMAHVVARRPAISPKLRSELSSTARNAGGSGVSRLAINGRAFPLEQGNPFDLYTLVAEESGFAQQIQALGLTPQATGELLSLVDNPSGGGGGDDAIRVRVDAARHIAYLNNLARDPMYQAWPKSLAVLTKPTQGFHRVRKNVVTAIYAADLASPKALGTIYQLAQFHNAKAPLRFGLLPILSDSSSHATTAVTKAFLSIRSEVSSKAAWGFLTSLAVAARGQQPTDAMIEGVLSQVDGYESDLDSVPSLDADPEVSEEFEALHQYVSDLGIPGDSLIVNTFVLDTNGPLQSVLATSLQQELARLGRKVADKSLAAETNVFKYVNAEEGVMSAFSTLVLPTAESPLTISPLPKDACARVGKDNWVYGSPSGPEEKYTLTVLVAGLANDPSVTCVFDTLQSSIEGSGAHPDTRLGILDPRGSDGLSWASDDVVVSINGRVIRVPPSAACTSFSSADVALALRMERESRVKSLLASNSITAALDQAANGAATEWSDEFALAASIVFADARRTPGGIASLFDTDADDAATSESLVVLGSPSSAGAGWLSVRSVIDPLSEEALTFVPLVKSLIESFDAQVLVRMNPVSGLESVPLQKFYGYALNPSLAFDKQSGVRVKTGVVFSGLPTEHLLTLGVVSPEAWLVEPVVAVHDLDNLRLEDLRAGESVEAVYELDALLVEGRAYQVEPIEPPTGLELVLREGTEDGSIAQDTVVMANLGYFQLKAGPGLWNLGLKPERRSEELYAMLNVTDFSLLNRNTDPGAVASAALDNGVGRAVAVTSFAGASINLSVAKKAGKEDETLLGGDSGSGGDVISSMWSSLTGSGGGGEPDGGVINVFSVASGHLYERFLKVMIKSVLANTESKVKFWFIRNFLSPSFKDFIPRYAEAAGFEYELVTYKWPRWLNGQTEKQRLIWGYKILFLDVIFPLDLDKVIFVDADQIVRADMKELVEMDLQGAPYGFTPFCDSNQETEGFRFWKQGYWASHLRGKPYHISALFVIDLRKFRSMSAGDALRGTYQSLSQDPNSLSNLDQDLPNYLQHQVPIFSLPQPWLWCQAWCAADTLDSAKTIDLCNNPLTKVPKLVNAKRFDEWVQYDEEVKAIEDGREHHQQQQQHDEL